MSFAGATYRDVGEGCLQGQKCLKDSCTTKADSNMGDRSQELGIWSTQHSLLPAQQVGESSFPVLQLVCTSLTKLGWLLFPVSSWAVSAPSMLLHVSLFRETQLD